MAGLGNPLIQQGSLNKVLTHVIVTELPQLSITAPYMSKALSTVTFEDDFVDQIGTATGLVNSPQPYVMTSVIINMLRSQSLSALWMAQLLVDSQIGPVTVYSDSTVFPKLTLAQCSVKSVEPGPYDGTDPTTKITLRGVYFTNNILWAGGAT